MNSSTSTSKKRKSPQSQTPGNNPHDEEEQRCEEDKGNNDGLVDFPHLPAPIITEILLRVIIKTLINCRLVCKSWASLIASPEFVQLHLSRSPTMCLIKPLNKNRQTKRLHLIDLECPFSYTNKLVFIPKINLPNVPLPLGLINSYNGLVCLCQMIHPDYNHARNIFVCNPVLGEYITIPKPPDVEIFFSYSCAFGFSEITNQYKVVLGSYDNSHNYQAQIYRLGEGSWRSIENAPYPIRNNNFNAFFNGALHWIGLGRECPYICCFDFVTEEFRAVPEPSEFDQLQRNCSDQMHVGVFNENLSVCDFNYYVGDRVIIWVMKDYGVKESWSKDFVITHMIYDTNWDTYEPIMVNGNGDILMIFNNDSIMLYDPISQVFDCQLTIRGVRSEFQATAHVPSLISLKDVARGENLKQLIFMPTSKRRKIDETTQEEHPEFEETLHQTSIPHLPVDIIFDILSWLTIKDLFVCRLVCKSWFTLLSDPQFAQTHLSKSPTNCLIKPRYKKKEARRFQLVDLQHPNSRYYKMKFMPNINFPKGDIYFINSCNGLLLLWELTSVSRYPVNLYVCNPILREYIMLPKSFKADVNYRAIGFCHKTDRYKVVRSSLSSSNKDSYQTEIYTIGEKCWRNIGNAPYAIANHSFNAFVNGTHHWPVFNHSCPDFIRSFDFVAEKFRIVPEPSEFGESQKKYRNSLKICVLNDKLSICDFSNPCFMVIWVMKEYGVKESWRKDYVIEDAIGKYDRYEPIMITNTGKVLVILNQDSILEYDPELESFKRTLKVFGINRKTEISAIAHIPSLVSLKDVAHGETVKVLGKN